MLYTFLKSRQGKNSTDILLPEKQPERHIRRQTMRRERHKWTRTGIQQEKTQIGQLHFCHYVPYCPATG